MAIHMRIKAENVQVIGESTRIKDNNLTTELVRSNDIKNDFKIDDISVDAEDIIIDSDGGIIINNADFSNNIQEQLVTNFVNIGSCTTINNSCTA